MSSPGQQAASLPSSSSSSALTAEEAASLAAADAELEAFTTIRVVHLVDERIAVPLLAEHAARLQDALELLVPAGTAVLPAAAWEKRIADPIKAEIARLAAEHPPGSNVGGLDRRVKVSVKAADQSHRVEFFELAPHAPVAIFAPSIWSLLTPPPPTRATIALSPRPLSDDEARSPALRVKTSQRDIYAAHAALAAAKAPGVAIQSVLLYVHRPALCTNGAADPDEGLFLTESTIANLLFLPPTADGENAKPWVTPRLGADTPLLPGLQRAHTLGRGEAVERNVSVAQAKRWLAAGGRVACCNALRGIWDVNVRWE